MMSTARVQSFFGWSMLLAFAVHGSAQSGSGLSYFQTTTFGMVGLGTDQIARLNVLNPGSPVLAGKPTCSVEMAFLDSAGRTLKSSTAITVEDDKAVALDIDRRDLSDPAARVQLRGVVKMAAVPSGPPTSTPIMPGSVCSLMPTLEVFDRSTGRTTIILSEGRAMILTTPAAGGVRPPRLPE